MFIINCIISTGNLRPRAVRNFPTVTKQVELDSVQIPNLCHQHFSSNLLNSSLHPLSLSLISNSFWVNRRHLEKELERKTNCNEAEISQLKNKEILLHSGL